MSLDRPLFLKVILSFLPRFFGLVFREYYNGLPISYVKSTIRFLTHKEIVGLQQCKNLGEVVHWIKRDLGLLQFNYDLDFFSAKLTQCFSVNEMSEFIEKNELNDVLNGEWWAVIHPIPTEDQVASFLNKPFK